MDVFFFINGGIQNEWFIMEHPIKMGDLEVPLFQETTILMIQVSHYTHEYGMRMV